LTSGSKLTGFFPKYPQFSPNL